MQSQWLSLTAALSAADTKEGLTGAETSLVSPVESTPDLAVWLGLLMPALAPEQKGVSSRLHCG